MNRADFRKRLLKLVDESLQDEDEQTFHDYWLHIAEHVEDAMDRSLPITAEPEEDSDGDSDDEELDLSGGAEDEGDDG